MQRWLSNDPFCADRYCCLRCSLSSLQKSSDHVKRNYILRELVTTVVRNLIIPMSLHDDEMRRYNTRYRGALVVKITWKLICAFYSFFLSKTSTSLERTCTMVLFLRYDDARIMDCCTFIFYLRKEIIKRLEN